jgi:hypothetical protein
MRRKPESVAAKLARVSRGETCPEYGRHLAASIASHRAPVPLPRTFEQLKSAFGEAPYLEDAGRMRELLDDNCHIGQRKLALSLIEFMNRCETPAFVVYPGASLMACLAAAELHPTARFLCFDPDYDKTVTNVRQELGNAADSTMRKVHIVREALAEPAARAYSIGKPICLITGPAGMYGDQSHTLALEVQAALLQQDRTERDTLFCSDVRMSGVDGNSAPSELQISRDMVAQAGWVQAIGASMFVLKFRMPFLGSDGGLDPEVQDVYSSLYERFGVKRPAAGEVVQLPYLAGERTVQLYGRPTTTEMRLVGSRASLREYAVADIERVMAPFNTIHRAHTSFVPTRPDARPPGFVDLVRDSLTPPAMRPGCSYDGMAEACIMHDALVRTGAAHDLDALRSALRRFSELFSHGRHPTTCATGQGHGRPRTERPQKRKRRGQPAFTPEYIGGSRRDSRVFPCIALAAVTAIFALM